MLRISRRLFGLTTKQAIIIKPPQITKNRGPLRELKGVKFPIYQALGPEYTPQEKPDDNRFNDKIPENCFTLKVIRNEKDSSEIKQKAKETPMPIALKPIPALPERKIVLQTSVIQSSVKKGMIALKPMQNHYLYDAVNLFEQSPKKVCKHILRYLKTTGFEELKKQGMELNRVYLQSVIVQKKKRTKKIRYHARARTGRATRDYSNFRLTFTERPLKDFFKQMILGKTPPHLSFMIKEKLLKEEASIDKVRQLQPFLHSKGRSTFKINFRRKVIAEWLLYKQAGKGVAFNLVWEKKLEEDAQSFEDKYGDFMNDHHRAKEERMMRRKELFQKNMENLA